MKRLFSKLGLVTGAVLLASQNASAAFSAPDFTGPIGDMGTAFGAILTLVVAFLGFKYIKRMFA